MPHYKSGISLVLFSFLFCAVQTANSRRSYRAAVIDYEVAYKSPGQSEEAYIVKNANKMVGLIEKAKTNKADIVVFPECGTMGDDDTYFIEVPDPNDKISPADNSSTAKVLQLISKAAKSQQIYVVINVHENFTSSDGKTKHFNTNIAFDRNGTVVARYRKYNLFNEDFLDRTDTPELVYFDTDFGVRFGMFICFDIIFEHPAIDLVRSLKISHFVYSAAWFSELPFMTSIQAQNMFAYGNDVALLASGLNGIPEYHAGSGIYRGKSGKPLTWQSEKEGTTMIVGNVSISEDSIDYSDDFIDDTNTTFRSSLILWKENLTDFNTKLISPEFNTSTMITTIYDNDVLQSINASFSINDEICRDTLCCTFNISVTNTYVATKKAINGTGNSLNGYLYYRTAVISGTRSYFGSSARTGEQICGIISCVNETNNSCGLPLNTTTTPPFVDSSRFGRLYLNSTVFESVRITGNFTQTNVLPSVSTLKTSNVSHQLGELVDNVKFTVQNVSYFSFLKPTLEFSTDKLISGAIYLRTYNLDSNGSANMTHNLGHLFFTIGISVFTWLWCYSCFKA